MSREVCSVRFFIIIFAVQILFQGCSQNILSELGNKNSDEALLFDAQTAVNAQQYDNAISIVTERVSASGRQSTRAREILASGYAGKCGLNFIEYVTGLSESVSGSTFVLVSSPFVGVSVSPDSCLSSLQTLDLIGTNAVRTTNQNAFASIVGMVLMGSATRLYTDDAPVDGDGSQDVVDASCALTDAQIDKIILGYGYMSQNFSAISDQIGASSSTTISDSITTCSSIAGSSCSNTDPAQITAQMRDTMRDLMNTTQYGVGTADGSNPILIPAACP